MKDRTGKPITYPNKAGLKAWLPVCSLGFAAFIFVTSELMPIGLLPDMAASLGKSESFTGLLITFYAWAVAIVSLPLTIATGSMDRKKLLMLLFAIFIVSHALAAFAANFGMLLLARICIAMAHAVFWSITTPLAARLAPRGKKARSLTIVITGASLATVLGVPLGSIMGHHLGWRAAFGAIGIMAFVVMMVLVFTLPKLPSEGSNNLRSVPGLFRKKTLVILYAITFLVVTGNFTAFSYLAPYFQQIGGFSPETGSFLLLIMGVSGIMGSIIATKYAESKPRPGAMGAIGLIFTSLCLLRLSAETLPAILAVGVAWGMSMASLGLVFQTTILRIAEDSADIATAIYSGTFNIGIGAGALVGGQVYDFLGLPNVGYAGAFFFFLAFLLALMLRIPPAQTVPDDSGERVVIDTR